MQEDPVNKRCALSDQRADLFPLFKTCIEMAIGCTDGIAINGDWQAVLKIG